MASKNEKYMNLYRRFEAVLKKSGFASVKDYEISLENDHTKQEQVRICRLIRNYIEHESATFVEASDNMMAFIEKEVVAFDESEMPVKKKMIPVKYAIRDTDLLVVAADFMTKRNQSIIPVFNKDDFAIGTLSYEDIVRLLAAGDFSKAKKVSVAQVAHKFGFLKEGSPMNKVAPLLKEHDKVYLVLNDTKKVIGWIV
jgi:predicted transcriptional regulator